MICNDTLHGVPLLLLANKQDLEVSCFGSSLEYVDLYASLPETTLHYIRLTAFFQDNLGRPAPER